MLEDALSRAGALPASGQAFNGRINTGSIRIQLASALKER